MENIAKLIFNRNELEIFYPPDQIEKWNRLKNQYLTLGYKWIDFSVTQSLWKTIKTDRKNQKKYNKMKRRESKMRNSFSGHGSIPNIRPPPTPTNQERYEMLKKWSINDNYNICMITYYLYNNHSLVPCKDYDPDDIKSTYNIYSQREQPLIKRANTFHGEVKQFSHPTAPPATRSINMPPSYNDLTA